MGLQIKCEECGLEFESQWSDEESLAELKQNFNDFEGECAILCDDCYKQLMVEINN